MTQVYPLGFQIFVSDIKAWAQVPLPPTLLQYCATDAHVSSRVAKKVVTLVSMVESSNIQDAPDLICGCFVNLHLGRYIVASGTLEFVGKKGPLDKAMRQ